MPNPHSSTHPPPSKRILVQTPARPSPIQISITTYKYWYYKRPAQCSALTLDPTQPQVISPPQTPSQAPCSLLSGLFNQRPDSTCVWLNINNKEFFTRSLVARPRSSRVVPSTPRAPRSTRTWPLQWARGWRRVRPGAAPTSTRPAHPPPTTAMRRPATTRITTMPIRSAAFLFSNTLNLDPDPEFWPNLDTDPGLCYQFWILKKKK